MNIPDDVIEQAARIAWADEPGASIVEFDSLNPVGRAELIETARKSAAPIAAWARREALREARNAIASLGYVIDSDVTGFPSGQAIDRAQALAAIRALAEGEQG